jgi:hypothetical protein
MARTVSISDKLAVRLEKLRVEEGFASLDAAAEALIAEGLQDSDDDWDEATVAELRALVAEAEAGGPAKDWESGSVKAEVLRRYAQRGRRA